MDMDSAISARIAPYGSWRSPVSTGMITGQSVRLSGASGCGAYTYWIESRPGEGGRSVIVRRGPEGQLTDMNPPPYNARSRVHEYGGGAMLAREGQCWFVNFEDQQIYRCEAGKVPLAVSSQPSCRFADLELDEQRRRLLAVCEDHSGPGHPENLLVAISLADGHLSPLVRGADFYSNPRLSPDAGRLAWLSWNHPHMPWDSSELWVADLDEQGLPQAATRVAGGEGISIFQPQWGPDGKLYFVSDADQWWNLYCWDGSGVRQVTREHAELGQPQWVFGMSTYGLLDQDTALGAFRAGGASDVRRIDLHSGATHSLGLPLDAVEHLALHGKQVLMLAASHDSPPGIYASDSLGGELRLLKESFPLALPGAYISSPEHVRFASGEGAHAHGFFYPPCNPGFQPPPGESPPLIVTCHGGPTAAASAGLDLRVQYWTSRGFAVLDVDYRGSTGYGRNYREALYGRWGVADVEDCVNGALHLAALGKADPGRLLIRGGSAGGYLVLCAAAFHDVFKAGASYYGIGELESMFAHTHKFESHYDRSLLGEGDLAQLLEQRSPARHARSIGMALIFFQGMDDRVVPPEQSEQMVGILRQQGVPVAYLSFEGEGHGFRAAQTISRCLEAELAFYARILQLDVAEPLPELAIDNLAG